MKRFCLMIAVLIAGITASAVMATSILIQKPEDVVKQSPLIVEVMVKGITFKPVSNLSTGEAFIKLTVMDRIVGDCPSQILIRRGHVTPALQFLQTEWDPSYIVGEHFIICLFPASKGYSTMGLYNGKFVIEQNVIKGTEIRIDEFKRLIREIRDGQRNQFPSELPRQTGFDVRQSLQKIGKQSQIMSAGSHLGGRVYYMEFYMGH